MRPAEVDLLIGDPTKARKQLGWEPTVGFEQLIGMMVDNDLELIKNKIDHQDLENAGRLGVLER
jgi:GDPmannose 4,6-dehydratase